MKFKLFLRIDKENKPKGPRFCQKLLQKRYKIDKNTLFKLFLRQCMNENDILWRNYKKVILSGVTL